MGDYYGYGKLIGKTVVSYELEQTGDHLTLHFKDGASATIATDAHCCSHTWIEDMDLPSNLLGTIREVVDLEMPDLGSIDGQRHKGVDVVSYYGLKITTDKGSCVLDYRNDSNGYYGGNVFVVLNEVPSAAV